jgi:hypothetical protein
MKFQKGLSKETVRRYTINFVMFFLFLFVAASSAYFLYVPGGYQGGRNPRYNMQIFFTREVWHDIHFWTSIILSAILFLHILLHLKWIKNVFLRTIKIWEQSLQSRNYARIINRLDDGLIALFFIACMISGLILYVVPGGRDTKYIEILSITRETWKTIHTITGIGMLAGVVIHLVIHWGWIRKVSKKVLRLSDEAILSDRGAQRA